MQPVNLEYLIPNDIYHEFYPILVANRIYFENYGIKKDQLPAELPVILRGIEFLITVEAEFTERELVIHKILSTDQPQLFLDTLNNLEPDSYFQTSEAHQKLAQMFLHQSPVKVAQHEGQRVLGKTLLLGTRLGPTAHTLSGLVHEMAHAIELPPARLLQDGWGFSYGEEVEVLGQTFFEPRIMQATDRECRTIAIEATIYDLIGYSYSIPDLVRALVYMNDFLYVPGQGEPQRLQYLAQLVTQYKQALNPDQILARWAEKMDYLKN